MQLRQVHDNVLEVIVWCMNNLIEIAYIKQSYCDS